MDAKIARRELLRTGAAAMTAASYSRVMGANDRLQLGVIGCGTRGSYVMDLFQKHAQVNVSAVCDLWGDMAAKAAAKAPGAKTTGDHRALLEMKPLDAVLIATPDHWHAAIAIDALNAGKDVYCEKPLTLRIDEGPKIVKAARVNKRVCQVGMQQRSGPHYMRLRDEWIRPGKLGKIALVRTWWHGNGAHLRKAPPALKNQPANLDWARYVSPVKWRDWDPQQYWNFRAYLDFGGGQVTDLFTHWIDAVHMIIGEDAPISATAAGGVYCYKDGRTAPDTLSIALEYPGQWNATFEATLAPGITGSGIEFCGTAGRAVITRGSFEIYPLKSKTPSVTVKAEREIAEDHVENFLACVRSRALPNGDVLAGHRSAQASHLGNIAYVEKRRLRFDPVREEILPL
jgi:predicted dehydrogenase